MGEVFIERSEPGDGGVEHRVPDGYGANGIWIRGEHDYAHPQVAGAIGSGRYPAMIAWIGEAGWIERRIVLDDAIEQVEAVTANAGEAAKRDIGTNSPWCATSESRRASRDPMPRESTGGRPVRCSAHRMRRSVGVRARAPSVRAENPEVAR